jgi:hypothetical protein
MKRVMTIFLLIVFTLSACAPKAKGNPRPGPNTPQADPPARQDTVQITPTPGAVPQTKQNTLSVDKPKGKNQTLAPTSSSPNLITPEILGRPTDNSVTINVVPAVDMVVYYEYGMASGNLTEQTSRQNTQAGVALETLLTGLKPDTRYYFRLHYADQVGPERSFMTQRSPGSSFTFGLQGDSHPERLGKQFDPVLYERTLRSAAADQPDFYLTIGDDFSVDTLKTVNADIVRSLYISQRQWLGLVGAPIFLVNGNHEQAALANLDGSPDNVAVWAQNARNSLFPQPAPGGFYSGDEEEVEFIGPLRDYYAWNWGDALFVVIDPYWHSAQTVDNQFGAGQKDKKNRDLWNITLGEAQYQWFKTTLEKSTAKYKFVFTHHVNGTGRGGVEVAKTYEWGDAALLANHRPGWEKTIHQLMADNNVTIFFQGHDHLFAHQELDGVVYQTLPEPANPNYTIENDAAYRSGDKLPNSGHVRVTVSLDGVKVDYVRSFLDKPDELAFSYTVK